MAKKWNHDFNIFISHTIVLLWKNVLTRVRQKILTAIELVLALILVVVVMLNLKLKYNLQPSEQDVDYHNTANAVTLKEVENGTYIGHVLIGYAPRNPVADSLMSRVVRLFTKKGLPNGTYSIQSVGFATEYDMMKFSYQFPTALTHCLAFNNMTSRTQSLPDQLSFITRPKLGDRKWDSATTTTDFKETGELYLMKLTMEAFINLRSGKDINISVKTMALQPLPSKKARDLTESNILTLTVLVIFFTTFLIWRNVYQICKERENRILMVLHHIGLSAPAYWFSWYITLLVTTQFYLLVLFIMLVEPLFGTDPILKTSNKGIVFVYLLFWNLCFTSFCILGTQFHDKAKPGAAITCFLYWFLLYPYRSKPPEFSVRTFYCLFPSINLATALELMTLFEFSGQGVSPRNLSNSPIFSDQNFLEILVTCLLSIPLYLVLAVFCHKVIIQGNSVWNFIPCRFCLKSEQMAEEEPQTLNMEERPEDLKLGIEIKNIYKGTWVKLYNISLNLYENQVTVFIGLEYSGKTSLLHVLRGSPKPTRGTVAVYGYDVAKDIADIRRITGICPKEDTALLNCLTVLENLKLFCKIKSSFQENANFECNVTELAQAFKLTKILNTEVWLLSASDKRMLQVALAFAGNSKVLYFDDPTSHMDPFGKTRVWNAIRGNMSGKTVVVSTSSMEEASMIGDRIAVFVEGRIKCCGSVSFLKSVFGTGYYLKIDKDGNCRRDRIKHVIRHYIKQAHLCDDTPTHMTFLLPLHETPSFYRLFTHLEYRKQELGVISFDVNASTLEEVFLSFTETDVNRIMNDEKSSDSDEKMTVRKRAKKDEDDTIHLEPGLTKIGSTVDPLITDLEINSEIDSATDVTNAVDQSDFQDPDVHSKMSSLMDIDTPRYRGFLLLILQASALFQKNFIISRRALHIETVQALFVIISAYWMWNRASMELTLRTLLRMDYRDPPTRYSYATARSNNNPVGMELRGLYISEFNFIDPDINNSPDRKVFQEGLFRQAPHRIYMAADFAPLDSNNLDAVAFYADHDYYLGIARSLTAIMNAYLQYVTDNPNLGMIASFLPRHFDHEMEIKLNFEKAVKESKTYILHVGFIMASVFMMVPHCTALERKTGAKHLQYLSGATTGMYWFVKFLFDYCNYFFFCNIFITILMYLGLPALESSLHEIYILLAMNGVMMHLYIYVIQFLFGSPSLALAVVFLLNCLSSELQILEVIMLDDYLVFHFALFLLLVPGNLLPFSIGLLVLNHRFNRICNVAGVDCLLPLDNQTFELCCSDTCKEGSLFCLGRRENTFSFDRPGVGLYMLSMAVHSCVWLLLLVCIERRTVPRCWRRLQRGRSKSLTDFKHVKSISTLDASLMSDVRFRKYYRRMSSAKSNIERPSSKPSSDSIDGPDYETEHSLLSATEESEGKREILLLNLGYQSKHGPKVRGITLKIIQGDVYCFVDPDKDTASTVMDLMCGRLIPSEGLVEYHKGTLGSCCKLSQPIVGYCPSKSAHLPTMTAREILTLHVKLRGIQLSKIKRVVDVYLRLFQLSSVADKQVRTLSENRHRRLSLAVAMIGEPPIILLNDPMNKLDINSKTLAWRALRKMKEMGTTIVMSSNNMDECAFLANQMAVMVNGQIVCMDKPNAIRQRYCNSYTLMAKIDTLNRNVSTSILVSSLMERFPDCALFRDHQDYVHMHVPYESESLADIFALMESTKKHLKIKDYTLRHTTLNHVTQVFQQQTEVVEMDSENIDDDFDESRC